MKRLFLFSIVSIVLMAITTAAQAQIFYWIETTGNDQLGMVGKPFPHKLTIKLVATHTTLPAPNIVVDFNVTSGNATVTDTATTNDAGIAEAEVTAGNSIGNITVKAYTTVTRPYRRTIFLGTYNLKTIEPVTRKLVTNGTGTSNVWKKFKGENVPDGVPDIIDWSYAGYKNGEERIPDTFNLPYYNVVDYGAIPNDGQPDAQAITDAIAAAVNGGIVFFPPGQYDLRIGGDTIIGINIGKQNGRDIILRGSGAVGASRGGTTIKMHNHTNKKWSYYFKTKQQQGGYVSNVSGTYPKGVKSFRVNNIGVLGSKKYIIIEAQNLKGDDWADHCDQPLSEMHVKWTSIRKDGINITEYHEIDRVQGNRIYLKNPTMTPLNSNYKVRWTNMQENMGIEDIHFDGGLNKKYGHLKDIGRHWITFQYTVNSWIRRCRFSNSIMCIGMSNGRNNTVYAIIQDGRAGHYTLNGSNGATSNLGMLVEVYTWDKSPHHGLNVSNHTVGNVYLGANGSIKGPDSHGSQPRWTLWDNYFGTTNQQSSGDNKNLPHHLDGYTRWNNESLDTDKFNVWTGAYGSHTGAIISGWKQANNIAPAGASYLESFGTHVYPNSLYIGQLSRRLGYKPAWIEEIKEDYENFFEQIYSNRQPDIEGPPPPPESDIQFNSDLTTTFEINENTSSNVNIGDPFIATDEHSDATITYSLENTTLFTINSETAQLKTRGSLDYEDHKTHVFFVKASNTEGVNASLIVKVRLLDVNEAPKITLPKYARVLDFGIDETNVIGKLIGDPITATDPDDADADADADGVDTLTYSLLSAGGDYSNDYKSFELDSETNQLKNKVALDYEDIDWDRPAVFRHKYIYGMKVRVTDSGGLSDTITTYVTVQNLDEPHFLDSSYNPRSIAERTEAGENVGLPITAFAHGDESDTDSITYSLSGDDVDSFDFNSETGQLITKAELDYETKDTYSVVVTASDGDLERSITVTINVTDVIEDWPLAGRTQQIQDAIVALVDDADTAEDVTIDHLSEIKILDVKSLAITSVLQPHDFQGLSSLQRLYIGNIWAGSNDANQYGTLPEGIFTGLNKLQYLQIEYVNLTVLDEDVFSDLSRLFSLQLGGNPIKTLPSGIFSNNKRLKFLYFNECELESLPEDVFSGLKKLYTLKLSNNNLATIPEDLFDGLKALGSIDLLGNDLTSVSEGLCANLPNLTHVSLSKNELTSIPEKIFAGLPKLSHVTLSYNDFDSLPDGLFSGISTMKYFDIEQNNGVWNSKMLFNVSLEKVKQSEFKVVFPLGAPHTVTFPITVTNGIIAGGRTSVAVRAGSTESNPLTVVRNADTDDAVTVSMGDLPSVPRSKGRGFGFSKSDTPLVVLGAISRAPGQRGKPGTTELLVNYPNPFNPDTWIPYQLARTSNLSITIYDIRGNVVRELSLGHQTAGYYIGRSRAAYWDGRNKTGERVSSGIYFYGFKTDDMSTVRKMIILK